MARVIDKLVKKLEARDGIEEGLQRENKELRDENVRLKADLDRVNELMAGTEGGSVDRWLYRIESKHLDGDTDSIQRPL